MDHNSIPNIFGDEIHNLRTLIITSVAGSFGVLVAAFGTDKMVDTMTTMIPSSEVIPKGAIVLTLWTFALLCLGFAFRQLSPSNPESPVRLLGQFKGYYESLKGDLNATDREAFEKRVSDKENAVHKSIEEAYRYTSWSFLLLSLSAIAEFLIGLKIF
jgi:hypothetical protein